MKWIWRMSYANMKQRRVRTGLTVLGVVIGVISIVSLLAIGIGVKNTILAEFSDSDSVRKITVVGVMEGKRKDKMITDKLVKDLSGLDYVQEVYPCLCVDGNLTIDNNIGYMSLVGVPQDYLKSLNPIFGNAPSNEGIKPELLIGQGSLYFYYNENTGIMYMDSVEEQERKKVDLTGKMIKTQFGFEKDRITSKLPVVGMMNDNCYETYCDLDVLKRYLNRVSQEGKILGQPVDSNGNCYNEWIYTNAIVMVDDAEHVEEVIKKLQNMGFQTENEKEYLKSMERTILVIQIMLGGVGMIALLVAIIGIGNTMTTSVYDRISEIGILKVLGCDIDELLGMFLLESGMLGGAGGLIGIACSFVLTYVIINPVAVKLLQLESGTRIAVIPVWLAFGALFFSVLLGILAGYLPARWAARLRPIDAVNRR